MLQAVINTTITIIVSTLLGYCISKIKNYKEKLNQKDEESKLLKQALMTMLQNNLTNTYYVYENVGKIPDYVYKNWTNSLKIYEKLGGNDYVHVLADKMKNWDFEKTDILKQEVNMKEQSFAMELLQDYKKANKRQFIIIIVILVMWFCTIGYLIYILNDIGTIETTSKQEIKDVDTIENSNVTNGDMYGEDKTNKDN